MHKIYGAHPAESHLSITPSDSTTYGKKANGDTYDRPNYLWVGVAGTLVVVDKNGIQITYTIPSNGFILPFAPYKIMVASTATNIVGLYA